MSATIKDLSMNSNITKCTKIQSKTTKIFGLNKPKG